LTLQRSQNYYHGFLILVCFCCVDNSEKEAGFSPKQAFLKVRADLPFLPTLSLGNLVGIRIKGVGTLVHTQARPVPLY